MPIKHVRLRRALVYPLQYLFRGYHNKDGQEIGLLFHERGTLSEKCIFGYLSRALLERYRRGTAVLVRRSRTTAV
jgi:hypothetical protein